MSFGPLGIDTAASMRTMGDMKNNEATTASKIVALLEDCYNVLTITTPDLPKVFFKLDHGLTLTGQVWGHFAPNAWTADGEARHEIMIASECLAAGAEQVLQTLIHEAVHALAEERGVKETSRQGRYHNKRFRSLAEELGMTYNTPRNMDKLGRLVPDERQGYSHVVLTNETRVRYMGLLDLLQKEIKAWRGSGKFTPAARRSVTHAYAVFVNGEETDVHQMGTTKYAKLSPYLTGHVHFNSKARQGDVEAYFAARGLAILPEGRDEFLEGGEADLSIGEAYPELVHAADRLIGLGA